MMMMMMAYSILCNTDKAHGASALEHLLQHCSRGFLCRSLPCSFRTSFWVWVPQATGRSSSATRNEIASIVMHLFFLVSARQKRNNHLHSSFRLWHLLLW